MIFLLHFGKSVFCRKNGLLQPLVRAFLSVWVYLRIGLGLKCQKRAKFRQIRRFAIFCLFNASAPICLPEGTGCFVPRGTFFRSFYREVFCRASSWNFCAFARRRIRKQKFPANRVVVMRVLWGKCVRGYFEYFFTAPMRRNF